MRLDPNSGLLYTPREYLIPWLTQQRAIQAHADSMQKTAEWLERFAVTPERREAAKALKSAVRQLELPKPQPFADMLESLNRVKVLSPKAALYLT